jgi:cell wall-associated NlpC family hydrolase
MRKSKGVKLPRVSRKQAYYGKYVTRSQLKPGDLIFFDTSRRRRGYVNHVGIYIGNGKFIHASSARHRVVITSLNSPFYRARFKWGRRVN